MTASFLTEIHIDERGIARIDDTNFKVIQLVMAMQFHQLDPKGLQEWYPSLTMAQIHAGLTYYYEHKDEMDCAIQRYVEESDQLSRDSSDPVLQGRVNQILAESGW